MTFYSKPTDNYGAPCELFDPIHDFINNCGIESVFEMFQHFYGTNYIKPSNSSVPYTGTLYDFNQNPYAPSGNADTDFMNHNGGIYIPLACQNVTTSCKLHVAFHGCLSTIYTKYSKITSFSILSFLLSETFSIPASD